MKNVRASKQTFQLSPCVFCGSRRARFYTCNDERGEYVAARCDRCGAQGPEIRGPIGDDSAVTDDMRAEAAQAWGGRSATPSATAPTFEVQHVPLSNGTNGHIGHHQNGSVA